MLLKGLSAQFSLIVNNILHHQCFVFSKYLKIYYILNYSISKTKVLKLYVHVYHKKGKKEKKKKKGKEKKKKKRARDKENKQKKERKRYINYATTISVVYLMIVNHIV